MTGERSEREQESATNFTKIQREASQAVFKNAKSFKDSADLPESVFSLISIVSMDAIQAYHQALIDEGMVIVPREPTEAMYKAWERYEYRTEDGMVFKEDVILAFRGAYKAMLDACIKDS